MTKGDQFTVRTKGLLNGSQPGQARAAEKEESGNLKASRLMRTGASFKLLATDRFTNTNPGTESVVTRVEHRPTGVKYLQITSSEV